MLLATPLVRLLPFFLLDVVKGQTAGGQNLDDIINKLFTKPGAGYSDVTERGPTPTSNNVPGTGTCECVPYYLCANGTIVEDGMGIIDIRIDDGPCDYLSICCEPNDRVEKPITSKTDDPKEKGCGNRNPKGVGFRITGERDNEAQFGEFPWMVALLREEAIEGNPKTLLVYQCGGSLIHPQVVLTAAHCVSDKQKRYKIRAGEWDTQTKNEVYPHQDRDVSSIIVHPQFYGGALFYDFALLILDSPLEITENVDVVCLPDKYQVVDNLPCYASGWGKDVFGKEGKYQVILKKIDLPIVDREICQDRLRNKTRLGPHFKLNESFICAGGQPGKDTCKGDGGSPLVCPIHSKENKYFQAGIVAWGIGCGEDLVPGVYAHVAKSIDWIDKIMISHNFDTSSYRT